MSDQRQRLDNTDADAFLSETSTTTVENDGDGKTATISPPTATKQQGNANATGLSELVIKELQSKAEALDVSFEMVKDLYLEYADDDGYALIDDSDRISIIMQLVNNRLDEHATSTSLNFIPFGKNIKTFDGKSTCYLHGMFMDSRPEIVMANGGNERPRRGLVGMSGSSDKNRIKVFEEARLYQQYVTKVNAPNEQVLDRDFPVFYPNGLTRFNDPVRPVWEKLTPPEFVAKLVGIIPRGSVSGAQGCGLSKKESFVRNGTPVEFVRSDLKAIIVITDDVPQPPGQSGRSPPFKGITIKGAEKLTFWLPNCSEFVTTSEDEDNDGKASFYWVLCTLSRSKRAGVDYEGNVSNIYRIRPEELTKMKQLLAEGQTS